MSTLGQRQTFSILKKAYAKAGRSPITTASTLRLQVPLASNKTSYTFPVLQGDETTHYAEQILLNRSDAFTATEVGLFIGGLSPAGAAVTDQTYALQSYPSAGVLAAVANAGILFYNSKLNIAINNVQYLQNFDTYRFYEAGVQQSTRIFGTAGSTTFVDSANGGTNGFTSMVPTLQFSGTAKVDITINLPNALTITNNCFLVLMFRGFLSLGASNLNK